MVDLDAFRQYAVIGPEEKDDEVELYLDAAKDYAKGAGVSEPEESSALYDLLIYRIATFYHDKRCFPNVGKDAEFLGINGLILQLRDG